MFGNVFVDEEYSFGLPSSAKVIVDVGAYIGLTSIFYAKKFPKARIFAIEPERSNFELMLKNLRPYPNVTPIHSALWSSESYVSIGAPLPGALDNWGFTHRFIAESFQRGGEMICAVKRSGRETGACA